MTEKASPNPERIKTSDQCRRQSCRKRGTHKNHSHDDCKFKEIDNTKFTNLGKAPTKKQRNAKTNSSQPTKQAQPLAKNANGAKCYICGKDDHLFKTCPDKGKIKAGAQSENVISEKQFMALWQSSFADQEEQQCATRILESWGDDVCATCMCKLSFTHRCDPKDIAIAKHTNTVCDTIRNTALLDTIQSAHDLERTETDKPAPIQMGFNFFHDAEGQSDN
jgi:hypothetical protein